MTADTYTATLGAIQMGTGNDNNTWGSNANSFVFQIFEDAIANVLTSTVTGGTLDALTDFVFNLGIGNYRTSTLCKQVNAGNWGEVKTELLKWDYSNGVVVPGLLRRREAEAALINM